MTLRIVMFMGVNTLTQTHAEKVCHQFSRCVRLRVTNRKNTAPFVASTVNVT